VGGGACATAALNLGACAGPLAAGVALAAGGATAVLWCACAVAAGVLVLATITLARHGSNELTSIP
jgi:predicted MFS family arabinose efflux permease